LEPEERDLVKGLIVNKFRGDISLFEDGVHILEEKSEVPVLGVVPYLHGLFIPEEDAVALENPFAAPVPTAAEVEIVVVHLPRIANFDDFDPLATEPGVRVRYVDEPEQIGNPAAIIIPGTKSTVNDLDWLCSRGFDEVIQRHAQSGGAVVGICGGYQMLGKTIQDPEHVESKLDSVPGLGLLPIETTFAGDKATHQASAQVRDGPGWFAGLKGQTVSGYEIHMGRTQSSSSWLEIVERGGESVQVADGTASADGKVWGCYVHGLFANQNLRQAWLQSLGWKKEQAGGSTNLFAASLTRLADTLESTLDMELLEKIVWES
jgi:adenosylcobyric acid synthase